MWLPHTEVWEENEIQGNSISGNHGDKLYAIKGGTNNTSTPPAGCRRLMSALRYFLDMVT
jgi:hypothetical protein